MFDASEQRKLTNGLIDPNNSPCHCYGKPTEHVYLSADLDLRWGKPTEDVYLSASLDMVGWECSACGHRWPTPWARDRARSVAQKVRERSRERG